MVSICHRIVHASALGGALFFVSVVRLANPSAEYVLEQIDARGAHSVLRELWNEPRQFELVCDSIETASPKWLMVARKLKSVSDTASALSLNYSVARALPRAPQRVLALIGSEFSIGDVCTSPYIEPKPGVAESYQRRAVAALRAVRAPQFAQLKGECLARVQASIAEN